MIHLQFPFIPPSANHAYESGLITRGKGRHKKKIITRRLSDEGVRYKSEVKKHLVSNHPQALPFFLPDEPYLLLVDFVFKGRETLHTQSWYEADPRKRAKNRYKRLDVSNRVKLFEDALAEAVGIDDRCNFFVGARKSWSSTNEATLVWVFNEEREQNNPINELFLNLRTRGAQPH